MPESSQYNHSLFCCVVKVRHINVKIIYLLDAGVRRHDGFTIQVSLNEGWIPDSAHNALPG